MTPLRLLSVRELASMDFLVQFEADGQQGHILVERNTLSSFEAFRGAVHRSRGLWVTHDCLSFNSPRQRREAWGDEISFASHQTKQAAG
jgi:hypothetical protein